MFYISLHPTVIRSQIDRNSYYRQTRQAVESTMTYIRRPVAC